MQRTHEAGLAVRRTHLHTDKPTSTGAVLTLAQRYSWFCNDIKSLHSDVCLNERLDCSRAADRPRARSVIALAQRLQTAFGAAPDSWRR